MHKLERIEQEGLVLCGLEAADMADDELIRQAEFGTVFIAHTLRQAEAPGINGVRQKNIIIPFAGLLAEKPLPRFARASHEHIRLISQRLLHELLHDRRDTGAVRGVVAVDDSLEPMLFGNGKIERSIAADMGMEHLILRVCGKKRVPRRFDLMGIEAGKARQVIYPRTESFGIGSKVPLIGVVEYKIKLYLLAVDVAIKVQDHRLRAADVQAADHLQDTHHQTPTSRVFISVSRF